MSGAVSGSVNEFALAYMEKTKGRNWMDTHPDTVQAISTALGAVAGSLTGDRTTGPEKGISGFKVSAENRDAIQDLKAAALKGEFQILLVFMFDRIGRIDDETPFVVEWFVKHGIRVWSVNEGEQRFESHVDKLMNYIRFWLA